MDVSHGLMIDMRKHKKTKKAPTGRIPTATLDCYSLHHRPNDVSRATKHRRMHQRMRDGPYDGLVQATNHALHPQDRMYGCPLLLLQCFSIS